MVLTAFVACGESTAMEHVPVRPTPEQLKPLSRFERLTFSLVDFVNTNSMTKSASGLFLRSIGMTWVYYCTRNLVHVLGLDNVRDLHPPRGLILASNHRSFSDQYVIACWLYRTTRLLQKIYFPVKADFWYQRPTGVAISLLVSALSMYPPVFREQGKRDFNHYGLRRLVQLLQEPGSVVGVHPEGTRNKSDDPYALLPAQPGIGKLIMDSRPTVLPIFINGLGNNFLSQVRSNFSGAGRPVVVVFGAPLDLEPFFAKRNTLRVQKEVADFVVEQIRRLSVREREYRAELERSPVRGPLVVGC
jgi:1-acyl-sn-glycerol-3-phosphate acyltransferase